MWSRHLSSKIHLKSEENVVTPSRWSNKPKQYIKGWVEFYKLKFKVTPDVLIPRPETELLVDEVISHVPKLFTNHYSLITILDLGTGSGCIAIALAKNLRSHPRGANVTFQIFATDVSPKALEIAKENARKNKVEKRIFFIKSDLLENIKTVPDVIVTNLPYIPSLRIDYLDSSVRDFEPLIALDGGKDGFDLYRKLFQQIRNEATIRDRKPKILIGEIDYTHGELAVNEALKYFPDAQVEVKTDLAHKQRILKISF